jgi:predicted AAA+ superfamily ATPase
MRDLVQRGVNKQDILHYNFESLDFSDIATAKELDQDVKRRMTSGHKYYLFFDEIQKINNFELALNSLRSTENVSIFVTGSNSKLLSSELSTELSGRFISFYIQPLSFRESMDFLNIEQDKCYENFSSYAHWGGLPHQLAISDEQSKAAYLVDVFNSIITRDITLHSRIRNIELFETFYSFLIENIGNVFSITKVVNTLKSTGRKVSSETLYEYLHALTSSLLLSKVERYNIPGKQILTNGAKYYANDLGLSQIKIAKSKRNVGAELENIVYNELIKRHYQVYIGHLRSSEIDFVAIRNGKIEYYQVTTYLEGNEMLKDREFGAFKYVQDNYPKYVLSLDRTDQSQDGIIHRNIVDWLMN